MRQQEDIFVRNFFPDFPFDIFKYVQLRQWHELMTTHVRNVWCINDVNEFVLLSAFVNALCLSKKFYQFGRASHQLSATTFKAEKANSHATKWFEALFSWMGSSKNATSFGFFDFLFLLPFFFLLFSSE